MDLFLKCLCIFFFFQMIVLMKFTNSKELFGHLKRHRLMCLYSTQPQKSPEEEQLCSHRYRPWEPNKSTSTCFNISGTKRLACLNRFSLDRARAVPGQARPGQANHSCLISAGCSTMIDVSARCSVFTFFCLFSCGQMHSDWFTFPH